MFRLEDSFATPSDTGSAPKFKVGQRVKHLRYHYHGLIVAMDERCQAPDDWYQKNNTQPSKDQPWYHVLVHQSASVTYAAETSLGDNHEEVVIQHPLVELFFKGIKDGIYQRNDNPWPGHT